MFQLSEELRVFFASWSELRLSEVKGFCNRAFTDEFNQTLLLKVEVEFRVGVENLCQGDPNSKLA